MLNKRLIEFLVGLLVLGGIIALFVLAFKVSGFSVYSESNAFKINAFFENVGDLKVRAPVTLAGVRIGEVSAITLDPKTFQAKVTLLIDQKATNLPADTAASIFTAGLIGANYISLSPGYADEMLKEGGTITETHPALVLENLIGQFIYRIGGDKNDNKDTANKGKK